MFLLYDDDGKNEDKLNRERCTHRKHSLVLSRAIKSNYSLHLVGKYIHYVKQLDLESIYISQRS